ncbi:hypothetical protein [Desnuesiella massiliensis]|uniref:hypothetical protein n=1 Tax=Desnuesiella massiliensis TaxID=1650662 RepID=UPI0006E29CC4|nr:hypothetical protein [Desnuesiella massiliensis]
MFWSKKYKLKKEKKENEEKLRKLQGREVRYASKRDEITYVETVIGKNGVINIVDDIFSVICNDKIIFSSPISEVYGSDLMSLDGIILNYKDETTGKDVEIMVYYKYYRKV